MSQHLHPIPAQPWINTGSAVPAHLVAPDATAGRWSDPLPAPGIVGLFLTGYLDTEVRIRTATVTYGDQYRWTLGPGIERTDPLRTTPSAVRAAIADLPREAEYRISLGWVEGDRRHHLASGRASLANFLLGRTASLDGAASADQRRSNETLINTAGSLGLALRQLRNLPVPHQARLEPPAGPTRLARWLRTGCGRWAAAEMHELLTTELGPRRVAEIVDWVDRLALDHLAHGRAGLHTTVVGDPQMPTTVLMGDDIAAGPVDFDLSCVLGELLIAEHLAQDESPTERDRRRRLISDCRDALLRAYGPTCDLIAVGQMTALRVLQELHDAAAYQDRMLVDLAVDARDLVDSAG